MIIFLKTCFAVAVVAIGIANFAALDVGSAVFDFVAVVVVLAFGIANFAALGSRFCCLCCCRCRT